MERPSGLSVFWVLFLLQFNGDAASFATCSQEWPTSEPFREGRSGVSPPSQFKVSITGF